MGKINLSNLSGESITNANNREIFNKYLNELYKYKPLSREEEYDLFKSIAENNDKNALDKVCKHNLRFVVSVAKRYSNILIKSTLTLEDLVSEGNVGLCIAATKFDYKSGNKFISYAVWWIRQNMITLIQNNVKNIRIPANVKHDIDKILKKQEELEQKEGCSISTLKAFEKLLEEGQINEKYTTNRISNMLEINSFEDSLNRVVGGEDTTELINLIGNNENRPDKDIIDNQRKEFTINMLKTLPIDIQEYFIDYFGLFDREELTLQEMSEKYGINRETIRGRIKKYLRFLKFKNQFNEPNF